MHKAPGSDTRHTSNHTSPHQRTDNTAPALVTPLVSSSNSRSAILLLWRGLRILWQGISGRGKRSEGGDLFVGGSVGRIVVQRGWMRCLGQLSCGGGCGSG